MKVKILVVDLEIPRCLKRWLIRLGIPVALALGASAAVWAATAHTWSTDDTLTATDLNASFQALQTQITALQAQSHPPSAFHAWLMAAPSPVPNGLTTVLALDQVEFDLGSEYNKTTGVFSPQDAGTYLLTCEISFNPSTSTSGAWQAVLIKNGNFTTQFGAGSLGFGSDGANITPEITVVTQLASKDQVTCAAFQESGTAQPLDAGPYRRTMFSGARLY